MHFGPAPAQDRVMQAVLFAVLYWCLIDVSERCAGEVCILQVCVADHAVCEGRKHRLDCANKSENA
jgi:hypothetical protein